MTTLAVDGNGNLITIPDINGLTIRSPLDYDAPITQAFGVVSVTGIVHRGIDQSIPTGTPLHTVADAEVISTYPYGRIVPGLGSDGSPGGYGNQVYLRHVIPGVGTVNSRYGHMERIYVSAGMRLTKGSVIGTSDDTGISTGPHLHWEMVLWDDVTRFDPAKYIDRVIVPPEPTEEEQLDMSFTPEELASLHKLADLDANGKTFAPGTPGRSVLIQLMDFYAALPDDAARDKFSRRLSRMLKVMGGTVATQPDAQQALDTWAYALSLA